MTQDELNELASDCRLAFGHQAGAYNDGVDAMLRAVSIAQAQAAPVKESLTTQTAVEPYATLHHCDGYFTTKQREHDLRYSGPMRTDVYAAEAIAAARVQENARIVELCKKRWKGGYPQEVIDDLVIAIHALLGKEAQS